MGIREQEDRLFEEWSRTVPDLVADGAVDEKAYESSYPKIALLLKEVNDAGGGRWDLREFLREDSQVPTWDNVARWLDGIRKLEVDVRWTDLPMASSAHRRQALLPIVVMNMKKSPGGDTTDQRALREAAQRDAVFLRRQFALYDADLTICCGVREVYEAILKPDATDPWRMTRRGINYLERCTGKFVIDFYHPAARVGPQLLYYGLIDAVREVWPTGAA